MCFQKFEAAVSAIGLRVDVGAMIWQSYLCFEEALLSGNWLLFVIVDFNII